MTADGAFEDDVAAVGRPAGEVVASGVMSQLHPALAGDVHDVDVLTAGGSRAVLAVPAEGEHVAGRRPRRGNGIAPVGEALNIGAVLVHGVNLRKAGTAAHPGDLRVGAWIPCGRDVGSPERCDLAYIA